MKRPFQQVDVFTAEPYRGNPLAVVLDGEGLSTEQMRRFAHWTNLSETTFVLPPTSPDADYRVRIFTPTQELPFAGHPTLGTCHAWLSTNKRPGTIVQECGAGLIQIRQDGSRLSFAAPPLLREGPVEPALLRELADGLGIGVDEIADAAWADNGPGWVALMLHSADAVLALDPGELRHDVGVVGAYPGGSPYAFEVRAFFPKDGQTVEDPVTGSLNASLAQWLLSTGRAATPYTASQGTALGRAGRVHLDQDAEGTVWVGGDVVTCVEGMVRI